MLVDLKFPTEFQGSVTGDINKSVSLALSSSLPWANFILSLLIPMIIFHLVEDAVLKVTFSDTRYEISNTLVSYGRRKGLIVGNDQEADDCVLTAHVCTENKSL